MMKELLQSISAWIGRLRSRLHPAAVAATLLVTALIAFVLWEGITSTVQAHLLANRVAPSLTYQVEEGPSPSIVFPETGPYNERLGYARIPEWVERLERSGYRVEEQARVSPLYHRLAHHGLVPVYREKVQTGLEILDRDDRAIFRAVHPMHVFEAFEDVPDVVLATLLFIENRTLLDSRYPHRNPAVEWRRLARASFEFAFLRPFTDRSIPGASTLATQMEKFRHSPEGITPGAGEKLRQMTSATIRTYLDGENSMASRRRIAVDYLNSVPLAAIAGHGEVIGLADGLWTWYGSDVEEVSRLLGAEVDDPDTLAAQGVAYRQVLGLLLAQRRPTWYLGREAGREGLAELVDVYLDLLAEEEVISPELRDAALAAETRLRRQTPDGVGPHFVDRKAANAVRPPLARALGSWDLYELDRLDLTVRSTFDAPVQEEVARVLRQLQDPEFVRSQGLQAPRLLLGGNPEDVAYAFTLYERTPEGHVVRVETDTFEGPFNLNRGTKLDLGSTAKLRTLVHYLEVIEELYFTYRELSPEALRGLELHPEQALARWTVDYLLRFPEADSQEILAAALQRRYSANPGERFYTGAGVHTFRNFDAVHNSQVLSVRNAFAHSVNLPFIRIMRDLVRHHVHSDPDSLWAMVRNGDDPRRQEYLERFAHREGRQFMSTFYRRYPTDPNERTRERVLEVLVQGQARTSTRQAWAFRSVLPEAGSGELGEFLRSQPQGVNLTPEAVERLYRQTDPGEWGLHDLGYLAGVHPLELHVVRNLLEDPHATLTQILDRSHDETLESYQWLFRTRHQSAQDQRLRILVEEEAFRHIHGAWVRLGYPFDSLVPSYATAIGSAADRPDSLAELVGIILNEGVRRPQLRIRELRFAEGTPYETLLAAEPAPGEQVLSGELSSVLLDALGAVITEGTGRRLAAGIPMPEGDPIPVAGKTGTGNHTFKVFGPGGRLLEERPVNRTATLVFTAGDRFYGTITAFVEGEESRAHGFTSSLPAQILRMLGPALAPLFETDDESAPVA